ncbi:MAG: hypothetical protein ACJAWW_002816, partial [Sulfurimonas sp.]
MKKFLKKIIILLIILASIYGVGRLGIVAYDSYGFVPRQPYAVMQTQNSITIKWHSNKFEEGTIEYGFFPDTLDKAQHENKKAKKHSLTISGLNDCTKYYYKVSSGSLEIDN